MKALARTFGIQLVYVEHADHQGMRKSVGDAEASPGPLAGALNPFTRTVYIPRKRDYKSRLFGDAVLMHEVMHVICAIPFHGENGMNVPEENLVMPLERAFAKALLPAELHQQVVDWQEATETCVITMLEDLGAYETEGFWQRGLSTGRITGMLDAENVPTLQWPDWTKLGWSRYKALVRC